MAGPENVENTELNAGEETSSQKKSGGKLVSLLVPIVAVLVFAGGGFFVGRMFGTRGNAQNVVAAEETGVQQTGEQAQNDPNADAAWYFDVDSVVANLNEPGVTRYVRIGLTLGMDDGLSEKEGTPLLQKKMPMLKDWLTLYMTNQTISDIQGEAKLRVVKDEIAHAFNKALFGSGPGHIKKVYLKELSIQ